MKSVCIRAERWRRGCEKGGEKEEKGQLAEGWMETKREKKARKEGNGGGEQEDEVLERRRRRRR